MNNKTVLITGCSSGIGYSVAKGLQQRGYRVIATARKCEDVERLNAEGLESLQLDLANTHSIVEAVDTVLERTEGQIYALFNNGAYGQPGAVEDLTRETLRQQFEINLFGTQELTNLIIPVMREQGEGRIIQNSSVLGIVSMPFRGAYNSTKFALEALSDAMRHELHGSGVYVSLIEPGPIRSRFRDNAMSAFRQHIDSEGSFFKDIYQGVEARLEKTGDAAPFTLDPEAVLQKVLHALEARRPSTRYPVTLPTYLFAVLKRILPDRAMDFVLRKLAERENR